MLHSPRMGTPSVDNVMADIEQPKRRFLDGVSPWADTFSKAIAGIAIAVYASGFLIVSLYHSKFGFVGTNPFRPRVLAAGVWFFFFTAIPVSIAARFRKYSWKEIAKESSGLWVACFGLSIPLQMLFDFSPASGFRFGFLWLGLGLFAVVTAMIVAANKRKTPVWVATISSVLLSIFYVSDPIRRYLTNHEFQITSLALWFFACTLFVTVEFKLRSGENLAQDGQWSKPLVVVFGFLFAFATVIYPHLKASWGGGTPANVTVYFTKDSLLNPRKSVEAQLVEESDEGFYIVGPKDTEAIFVPRSAVALLYFSDKAANSVMLRDIK